MPAAKVIESIKAILPIRNHGVDKSTPPDRVQVKVVHQHTSIHKRTSAEEVTQLRVEKILIVPITVIIILSVLSLVTRPNEWQESGKGAGLQSIQEL